MANKFWLMGVLASVPMMELQKAHERRDYHTLARLFGGTVLFHRDFTEAKFDDELAAEAFNSALRPLQFPGSKLISYPGDQGRSIFWYHEPQKRSLDERLEAGNLAVMTMHDKVVPEEWLRALTKGDRPTI